VQARAARQHICSNCGGSGHPSRETARRSHAVSDLDRTSPWSCVGRREVPVEVRAEVPAEGPLAACSLASAVASFVPSRPEPRPQSLALSVAVPRVAREVVLIVVPAVVRGVVRLDARVDARVVARFGGFRAASAEARGEAACGPWSGRQNCGRRLLNHYM